MSQARRSVHLDNCVKHASDNNEGQVMILSRAAGPTGYAWYCEIFWESNCKSIRRIVVANQVYGLQFKPKPEWVGVNHKVFVSFHWLKKSKLYDKDKQ